MKRLFVIICFLTVLGKGGTISVTNSIALALSAAHDGDTILVKGPNIFREPVILEKSVKLVGVDGAVIDANGKGTILTIDARNVEIRDLTFRNSGNDLANFDSAIMVLGSSAQIINCHLVNNGFGIFIRGATNCLVRGNEISGETSAESATRGNGIHLWKTKRNLLDGNSIRSKRDGVYLSYADENWITNNRVGECRFGIHYMYSHKNRLLANTLSANAVGATLMFARNCLVEGNQISANRRHGILLKQFENSRLVGNFISGHNRGLFVQQATKDRFENNTLSKNDIGLYLSGGSEQNTFIGNAFLDNTDQVWQPPDEMEAGRSAANVFYEKGHGNFWSDYTGVDIGGDGIGDTPYHETDVYGYILDRHVEARIFALSPAVTLLRKSEELLPLLETSGVTDLFPLIRQPKTFNPKSVASFVR